MSEQRDRDDCEHGPSARECDCNAIELQAEIERLRAERDEAITLLARWSAAVDRDSSQDSWDHHYKAARWDGGPLRELIDIRIQQLAEEGLAW